MKVNQGIWTGLLVLTVLGCGEETSVTPVETESVDEDTASPQGIEEVEADGSEEPETGVVRINEIVANASDDGPDWVELYNPSEFAVELGNFRIEDEDDTHIYVRGLNTMIGIAAGLSQRLAPSHI